jgi:transposase
MARNRKNQSAAIRFGPALKALLLCLAIGGSGIGYVWQKQQISELSAQIRKRETRIVEMREQNDKLRKQLATLLSPKYLDMRVKELKLGLVQPQQAQIWRLTEPAGENAASAPQRDQQQQAAYAPEQNHVLATAMPK